jgi:ketosteroid isomerase-like protein
MNNNLASVAAIYEAFGKGDIPSIIEHVADNVEWEKWADNSAQKASVPWMLPRKGKEGVIDFLKR